MNMQNQAKHCILRRTVGHNENTAGWGSNIYVFASMIYHAIKDGYKPVVDLATYACQQINTAESRERQSNPWEVFFKQDSLKDALAESCQVFECQQWRKPLLKPKELRMVCREHIRLTDPFAGQINRYMSELDVENTLGVLVRGTNYTNTRPRRHPIQPEIGRVILDIRNFIYSHPDIRRIFVCTESQRYYEILVKNFGCLITSVQDTHFPEFRGDIATQYDSMTYRQKMELARQYLASLMIMSRLQNTICSVCSGYYVIDMFRQNEPIFEKTYNLGLY